MVTQLTDIPGELIDNICQFLEAEDISRFRLTCTNIRDKSYHGWAISSFQQIEFMITRSSLQCLIDFSKHEKFAPCIRDLRINTVSITESGLAAISNEPFQTQQVAQGLLELSSKLSKEELDQLKEERDKIKRSRRRAWSRLMHDQNLLRKQSIDVAMLVEAMRNLPNLETVEVCCDPVRSRVWGANELRKLIGKYPLSFPNRRHWQHWWVIAPFDEVNARVFATVLSAIATSGVKLRKLSASTSVSMAPRLPATPNHRSRSFIPRQTLSEAHMDLLKPAFSQLKTLHLTAESWKNDPQKLNWITRFFDLCPNLEDFYLDATHDTAQFINHIAKLQPFPKLRVLGFCSISVSLNDLVDFFISHASTLERIHLNNVKVHDGSFIQILKALQALPRLNFVNFTNDYTQRYMMNAPYRWYSANGTINPDITVSEENGQKMAEQLKIVITQQMGWHYDNLRTSRSGIIY